MSGPYSLAQILLVKASEDEQALNAVGNPDSILGFHAQQAIEKLMKALLACHSVPFELTHNLTRLETALRAAGENLPPTPIALSDLTDFAVVYRYDLLSQFGAPESAELIETVRLVREHVVSRIAALSSAP
jgi:HEPN domain-containing protein